MSNDQSAKLREQMQRKFPKYFPLPPSMPTSPRGQMAMSGNQLVSEFDRVELTAMGELLADAEALLRDIQQRKNQS